MHPACKNAVYYRLSMSVADFGRSLDIFREMNIYPALWLQSFSIDRLSELLAGTMIKVFWRFRFLKLHIHRNRMPLICPDKRSVLVERVPLFFIRANNLLKHFPVKILRSGNALNQFVDIRPTVFIKSNPYRFRFMS